MSAAMRGCAGDGASRVRLLESAIQRLHSPPARTQRRRRQRAELLDAAVVRIRHVNVPACIQSDTERVAELPAPVAGRAPLGNVLAVASEHLNAAIESVRDVDPAASIDCNASRARELPVRGTDAAPLG